MRRMVGLLCVVVCACAVLLKGRTSGGDELADSAHKLHFSSIVLDTHDDTTQRFFSKSFDLGKRNPDGHVDIPRMREGGLDAEFLSVFVPPMLYPGEKAYAQSMTTAATLSADTVRFFNN